jgi:hypothetical protein
MTDLLAIVGTPADDEAWLSEIAHRRPDRVTVLIEHPEPNWADEDSDEAGALRDRLAVLLAAIERRTGAVVVGLAGSREQLQGWRFDRVVDAASRPRLALVS